MSCDDRIYKPMLLICDEFGTNNYVPYKNFKECIVLRAQSIISDILIWYTNISKHSSSFNSTQKQN